MWSVGQCTASVSLEWPLYIAATLIRGVAYWGVASLVLFIVVVVLFPREGPGDGLLHLGGEVHAAGGRDGGC